MKNRLTKILAYVFAPVLILALVFGGAVFARKKPNTQEEQKQEITKPYDWSEALASGFSVAADGAYDVAVSGSVLIDLSEENVSVIASETQCSRGNLSHTENNTTAHASAYSDQGDNTLPANMLLASLNEQGSIDVVVRANGADHYITASTDAEYVLGDLLTGGRRVVAEGTKLYVAQNATELVATGASITDKNPANAVAAKTTNDAQILYMTNGTMVFDGKNQTYRGAGDGRAFYVSNGTFTLQNATLDSFNSSSQILYSSDTTILLDHVTIQNCSSTSSTLGFASTNIQKTGTLTNCVLKNNLKYLYPTEEHGSSAIQFGGVATYTMSNCTIGDTTANTSATAASHSEGSIGINGSCTVNMDNCTMQNCYSWGGTIYMYSGTTLNMDCVDVLYCTSCNEGGAIKHYGGNLNIIDSCSFANNSTLRSSGGALYFAPKDNNGNGVGNVIVTNSTFENNLGTTGGGAIYNNWSGAHIEFNGCDFSGNSAGGTAQGETITNSGTMFFNNCDIEGTSTQHASTIYNNQNNSHGTLVASNASVQETATMSDSKNKETWGTQYITVVKFNFPATYFTSGNRYGIFLCFPDNQIPAEVKMSSHWGANFETDYCTFGLQGNLASLRTKDTTALKYNPATNMVYIEFLADSYTGAHDLWFLYYNANINNIPAASFDLLHDIHIDIFDITNGVPGMLVLDGTNVYNATSTGAGAAIHNSGYVSSVLNIFNSDIYDNTSTGDNGGAITNGGTLCISGGDVRDNRTTKSGGFGGAIYTWAGVSTTELTGNVLIHENQTTNGYGGAIAVGSNTNLVINSAEIYDNTAQNNGAAIANNGDIVMNGGLIECNTNTNGGGHAVWTNSSSGYFEMYGGSIYDNYCGGVYLCRGSYFDMYDGYIGGNSSTNGGGIYNNGGYVDIEGGEISGNSAADSGGGIFNTNNGSLYIESLYMEGNEAGIHGGAIRLVSGSMSIYYSDFNSNTASNGGAIYAECTFDMTDCRILDNSASNHGADIWLDQSIYINYRISEDMQEEIIDDEETVPGGLREIKTYIFKNNATSYSVSDAASTYIAYNNDSANDYEGSLQFALKHFAVENTISNRSLRTSIECKANYLVIEDNWYTARYENFDTLTPSSPTEIRVVYGQPYSSTVFPTPTKLGYDFVGWSAGAADYASKLRYGVGLTSQEGDGWLVSYSEEYSGLIGNTSYSTGNTYDMLWGAASTDPIYLPAGTTFLQLYMSSSEKTYFAFVCFDENDECLGCSQYDIKGGTNKTLELIEGTTMVGICVFRHNNPDSTALADCAVELDVQFKQSISQGLVITNQTNVFVEANHNIEAVWTPHEFTVVFDTNGKTLWTDAMSQEDIDIMNGDTVLTMFYNKSIEYYPTIRTHGYTLGTATRRSGWGSYDENDDWHLLNKSTQLSVNNAEFDFENDTVTVYADWILNYVEIKVYVDDDLAVNDGHFLFLRYTKTATLPNGQQLIAHVPIFPDGYINPIIHVAATDGFKYTFSEIDLIDGHGEPITFHVMEDTKYASVGSHNTGLTIEPVNANRQMSQHVANVMYYTVTISYDADIHHYEFYDGEYGDVSVSGLGKIVASVQGHHEVLVLAGEVLNQSVSGGMISGSEVMMMESVGSYLDIQIWTDNHQSYITDGFYYDDEYIGGVNEDEADPLVVEGPMTIEARFKPRTYTITYRPNGASGSDITQTVTYGQSFTTKPANTFSWSGGNGVNFDSWSTNQNTRAQGSYTSANTSYVYNTKGNTTLYAIFSKTIYFESLTAGKYVNLSNDPDDYKIWFRETWIELGQRSSHNEYYSQNNYEAAYDLIYSNPDADQNSPGVAVSTTVYNYPNYNAVYFPILCEFDDRDTGGNTYPYVSAFNLTWFNGSTDYGIVNIAGGSSSYRHFGYFMRSVNDVFINDSNMYYINHDYMYLATVEIRVPYNSMSIGDYGRISDIRPTTPKANLYTESQYYDLQGPTASKLYATYRYHVANYITCGVDDNDLYVGVVEFRATSTTSGKVAYFNKVSGGSTTYYGTTTVYEIVIANSYPTSASVSGGKGSASAMGIANISDNKGIAQTETAWFDDKHRKLSALGIEIVTADGPVNGLIV